MKKYFKFLLLSFVLIFSFNFQIDRANAAYSCDSSSVKCADATLSYGKTEHVFSSSVYYSKGEEIIYSWENDSPGIFHVAFYIVRGNEKVSPTVYAPSLGDNYGTYPVSESGWYSLYALCNGGTDNRCQGGGRISKF